MEGLEWREDDKEDVSSYWVNLRKGRIEGRMGVAGR
jgi:hypothetical protein